MGMFATFHGHSGVSFDQDWLMGAKIIIDGMSLGHCVSMSFGFSKNTTGQTRREKRRSQDRNSRATYNMTTWTSEQLWMVAPGRLEQRSSAG